MMKIGIGKILNLVLILVLTGLFFGGIYVYSQLPIKTREGSPLTEEQVEPLKISEKKPKEEIPLPDSLNLDIPFLSQAPLGDWSSPFDHTCEEAAILMVHYFFEKEEPNNPVKVSKDLENLVDFQTKEYGFSQDNSAAQTAKLIKDYYGYKAEVYYDISLEDIKKELFKENPVIVPVAGRLLGNPYYTPPGPINHMLVIKGYNQNEFITNDPGTKRGADFTYSYQVLEKAIRDYGENVKERKAMIVIYPSK